MEKPVQIFKNLENHIEYIVLVLLVTVLSMIAHLLTCALIDLMTPSLSTNQYNQYRNMFSIIDLRKYN